MENFGQPDLWDPRGGSHKCNMGGIVGLGQVYRFGPNVDGFFV